MGKINTVCWWKILTSSWKFCSLTRNPPYQTHHCFLSMKNPISLGVRCWRKFKFWIWLEHLPSHTNFQEYNICCMVDRNSTRELWHMPCHWHIICSVSSCNVCSYCGSTRSTCGRIQPRENTRNLQLPVSSFCSHHFIPHIGKLFRYELNWLFGSILTVMFKSSLYKGIQCRLVVAACVK